MLDTESLLTRHQHLLLSVDPLIENKHNDPHELVDYHQSPVSTISYYIHSLISKKASKQGFKVIISGTGADELFTGYYDHFLYQLATINKSSYYEKNLSDWKKYISSKIRNPLLKNYKLFINSPNFREHLFDSSELIQDFLKTNHKFIFKEKFFFKDVLKNRLYNELFHEVVPVILHEDDLNSMMNSIENRSPYLDTSLLSLATSIPSKYLIQDGFNKYILRESMNGILNDKVRLDRQKKGFNASINSLINLKDDSIRDYLLDENSNIGEFVNLKKMKKLFDIKNIDNSFSKFIFNFINCKLFMDAY